MLFKNHNQSPQFLQKTQAIEHSPIGMIEKHAIVNDYKRQLVA
jgi:hypothetical protein